MGNHRQVQLKIVNHPVNHPEEASIASIRWIRSGHGQTDAPRSTQSSLPQSVLSGEPNPDALWELCEIVGTAFQADCCLIAQQSRVESFPKVTAWGTKELAPLSAIQDELMQVLEHPLVVSQWQFSELLAIADLDLLDFQPGHSSKRKRKAAAKSRRKSAENPTEKSFLLSNLNSEPFAAHAAVNSATKSATENSPRVRSILAIHTQLHGHVNGVIAVVRSQPWDWQESDVTLLRTLAPRIAVAISHAQLEHQVQQQIQYQALNNQLTAAIRNNWSLDDIFELALEGVVTSLQVRRGSFLLMKYTEPVVKNRSSETLPIAKVTVVSEYPKACSGGGWAPINQFPANQFPANQLPANQLPTEPSQANPAADPLQTDPLQTDPLQIDPFQPDETCIGESWLHKSFWTSDCSLCRQLLTQKTESILLPTAKMTAESYLREVAQDQGELAPLFDLTTMPSLMMIPIENQGTVLGCLVLQHHQPRLWSIEEISFVKLVAAQLSTAIIQIRTLQQVQSVVNERTAQLQRSLEVQAKLYEKTRQQVNQLRRLNEEREVFLSTVSHELLTPLTSMRMAIQMLKQEELSPDRTNRYLAILEQQCNQETKLINDMLALRKLESTTAMAQLHKIDLKYLIRDIALTVAETWSEKALGLEIDLPVKPLSIYTDPDSLNRILVELLNNAKKYSEANSQVLLQVSHQVHGSANEIVLMFKNVGYGIQPDELPFIFDKFRRGQVAAKEAIQGTGLGLALVKGLVEHLNGTIAVASHPLPQSKAWETCFTITLPQASDRISFVSP